MTRFETAAREFIASRSSPRTREAYTADLSKWLAFCAEAGVLVAAPTTAAATAFRDALAADSAPMSVRRTLAALSAIYRYAVEHEDHAATRNPFSPRTLIRPRAPSEGKTQVVTEEDARAILAAVDAGGVPRDAALLHLLRATGIRRAGAATIRRSGLVDRAGSMTIAVVTKGGAEGRVEVPADAARAVRAWLEATRDAPDGWLFPNRSGGHLHVTMVNKILSRWAKIAGVKHVHPHQFRAAYITDALDVLPLYEVQRNVQHADPRTTQRYDRNRRGAGVADAVAAHRRKK